MIEKLKHLIYKEWLKTRWYATIALLLSLGTVIYIFISIRSDLNLLGAPQYFSSLILEKSIFFGKFKYIPIITALLIGLSQFVPEVTDKRIKLSLHLPMDCYLFYGTFRFRNYNRNTTYLCIIAHIIHVGIFSLRNYNPFPTDHSSLDIGRYDLLLFYRYDFTGTNLEIPFPIYYFRILRPTVILLLLWIRKRCYHISNFIHYYTYIQCIGYIYISSI